MDTTLRKWINHAELMTVLHDRAAEMFDARSKWFSMPALILTTFTSSALLSILSQDVPPDAMKYTIAVTSTLSTILAAADRLLGYRKQYESHIRAKTEYGSLSIDMTEKLANNNGGDSLEFAARLKQLNEVSPVIPEKILNKYNRQIDVEMQRLVSVHQGRPRVRSLNVNNSDAVPQSESLPGQEPQIPIMLSNLERCQNMV
jgi:hypothetical protein